MKSNIKPALVLAAILLVVCSVLVLMNTYAIPDLSGTVTGKVKSAYTAVTGRSADNLEIVPDFRDGTAVSDSIKQMFHDKTADVKAFEVVTDGYNSGGIDVLVVMNGDGSVAGVTFVTNSETPGIGTPVGENAEFMAQFAGSNGSVTVVKGGADRADNTVVGVSGATYTSRGVAAAVSAAVEAYGVVSFGAVPGGAGGSGDTVPEITSSAETENAEDASFNAAVREEFEKGLGAAAAAQERG